MQQTVIYLGGGVGMECIPGDWLWGEFSKHLRHQKHKLLGEQEQKTRCHRCLRSILQFEFFHTFVFIFIPLVNITDNREMHGKTQIVTRCFGMQLHA